MTKLRKAKINESKRKIIVKGTVSGDFLKGIPPVLGGERRGPL
jgi:hypothetical protein